MNYGKYGYSHALHCLLLLLGWTALLFACSDEDIPPTDCGTEATVHFTIRAAGEMSQLFSEYESKEYVIKTLRMYVFSETGQLLGYHYQSNETTNPNSVNFKLKLPTGKHTFYVIANEAAAGPLKSNNEGSDFTLLGPTDGTPANMEEIGQAITPEKLMSLTFSKLPEACIREGNVDSKDETDKIYDSPLLPMASRQEVPVMPNAEVKISLTRSVAKMKLYFSITGAGECYMGRGIYLYHEPKYGYLFPENDLFPENGYTVEIGRVEDTAIPDENSGWADNPSFQDSRLHQLNGRVILHSGWPAEPENYTDTEHTQDMLGLDINRITANVNDPQNPQYDHLPQKSFYLFANPYQIGTQAAVSATRPVVTDAKRGYYLKIMVHQHGKDQTGVEKHKGEKFYLTLPVVKANDCLSVYSVVTLDGHVSILPLWRIEEWQPGGGDITFN